MAITKYSDKELKEFKLLIESKITKAESDLALIKMVTNRWPAQSFTAEQKLKSSFHND